VADKGVAAQLRLARCIGQGQGRHQDPGTLAGESVAMPEELNCTLSIVKL